MIDLVNVSFWEQFMIFMAARKEEGWWMIDSIISKVKEFFTKINYWLYYQVYFLTISDYYWDMVNDQCYWLLNMMLKEELCYH